MGLESKILRDLEDEGILDIYWAKGNLYIINEWDEEPVRSLIETRYPNFPQNQIVAETPQSEKSYFGV